MSFREMTIESGVTLTEFGYGVQGDSSSGSRGVSNPHIVSAMPHTGDCKVDRKTASLEGLPRNRRWHSDCFDRVGSFSRPNEGLIMPAIQTPPARATAVSEPTPKPSPRVLP